MCLLGVSAGWSLRAKVRVYQEGPWRRVAGCLYTLHVEERPRVQAIERMTGISILGSGDGLSSFVDRRASGSASIYAGIRTGTAALKSR